ncbi:SLC13 family permease [Shouchella clausii]|uniref:SLC13 family permease n=1 Tax=Shouchella clausii TaxID=79880 RepID=UPI000BA5B6D6|nr:SLC13 family permease [Shouchella clausii]PAD17040.1 hypothetical protein CHH73_10050 [Shouchella clausii]PAE96704.1 hypothetical protein CHH70_00955 [Shouchella clausii]
MSSQLDADNMKKPSKATYKYVVLGVLLLFLFASPFLPVPESMELRGWSALAVVTLGIGLWFTHLLPPAVTAMLLIVLFPLFGVLTFEQSAASLGKEVIWLIIAMLMMGAAVERTGLDKRIAFTILTLTKGNVRLVLLALIFVGFVLTFFLPNAIGRVVVLLPVALGVIQSLAGTGGPNVGKASMFAITYTPIICSVALITGATGSVYAASLFETMLGFEWRYLYWMAVMLPSTLAILLILWLALLWLFPVKAGKHAQGEAYFKQEKEKLGPMSFKEKTLLILYVLLITLWTTQSVHQLSISFSAVLIVIALYIPGIQLMEWKEAVAKVEWSIPLLFSAGFSMAEAFEAGGVVQWSSSLASAHLNGLPAFTLAVSLLLVVAAIRIGFTNLTAMIASLMPVALTFAAGSNVNPVWLGMICLAACSTGFLFPSQSVGTMMTYALGYYTSQELLKVGAILTLSVIVITLLAAFLYWPLIGLPVH